jgi:hypothetical protein
VPGLLTVTTSGLSWRPLRPFGVRPIDISIGELVSIRLERLLGMTDVDVSSKTSCVSLTAFRAGLFAKVC